MKKNVQTIAELPLPICLLSLVISAGMTHLYTFMHDAFILGDFRLIHDTGK